MIMRVCLQSLLSVLVIQVNALKPLIVGLNKYSHDASCCILDSISGKILFSQAKERISRSKHDGGSIGELLQYGLQSIDASIDDIAAVVSNNHHHRVLPYERRLGFYNALKYAPADYSDVSNLIPDAQHFELSHHLAHAWSVVGKSTYC
jgi:predicted NodU family carbamoyl transferase